MQSLFTESRARAAVFAMFGGLGAWLGARWIWPWAGPWLLEPCPIATALGCKVALVAGALYGLGEAWKLEMRERSQRLRTGVVTSQKLAAMRRPPC